MRRKTLWFAFGAAATGASMLGLLSASCVDDGATGGVVVVEGGVDVIVVHAEAGPVDANVHVYSDGSVGECADSAVGTANIFPCDHGKTYCLAAMNCGAGSECGLSDSGGPNARIQCNTAADCNPLPTSGGDDGGDEAGDDGGSEAGPSSPPPISCCASVTISDAGLCPIGISPNNPGNITNCAATCETSQLIVCTAGGNECPAGKTCRPGLSDFGGFSVKFGFCY